MNLFVLTRSVIHHIDQLALMWGSLISVGDDDKTLQNCYWCTVKNLRHVIGSSHLNQEFYRMNNTIIIHNTNLPAFVIN